MTFYRSWMFVPGNHRRRLDKVRELQSDVIIYDLEDAVPLNEKENAREMVRETIRQFPEKVNFVRVNDVSTCYFLEDVNGLACGELAGIVLPKANTAEDIRYLERILSQAEKKKEIPEGKIEILPIIESALGLYNAFQIACASRRVKRLAFGSVDFTLDINARLSKEGTEILYARSQLVVASRAAGIEGPIDAVFVDLKDDEGLLKDARLAKQLGFQGKLAVHPGQVGIINQIFTPTDEEIEEAKIIAAAFDEAVASGLAAIQVAGKMVDYPVAVRAKKIVEQAKALGK